MAQTFNEAHAKFLDWVLKVEPQLRAKEATGPEAEEQVQVWFYDILVEQWNYKIPSQFLFIVFEVVILGMVEEIGMSRENQTFG